jgi:hypothetical protein
MPKQCLPTPEEFTAFANELAKRSFHAISARELCKQSPQVWLVAPRKIEGSEGDETGFRFHENGLTVIVWTTWMGKYQRAHISDAGWIIILDEKMNLCYSSRPIHRTKNFLKNLFMQARIARARVARRPRCGECNHFMRMVHGKGTKAVYWRCSRILDHKGGRAHSTPFDYGLPKEALDYLSTRRKAHRKALLNLRAQGKTPFAAMRRRKLWMRQRAVF